MQSINDYVICSIQLEHIVEAILKAFEPRSATKVSYNPQSTIMNMHLNLNYNQRPLEVRFNMMGKCHCSNARNHPELKGFWMKLEKWTSKSPSELIWNVVLKHVGHCQTLPEFCQQITRYLVVFNINNLHIFITIIGLEVGSSSMGGIPLRQFGFTTIFAWGWSRIQCL